MKAKVGDVADRWVPNGNWMQGISNAQRAIAEEQGGRWLAQIVVENDIERHQRRVRYVCVEAGAPPAVDYDALENLE